MTKSTIEQRVVILNAAREAHNAARVMEELHRGQAHVAMVRGAAIHLSETYAALKKVADAEEAQELAKLNQANKAVGK